MSYYEWDNEPDFASYFCKNTKLHYYIKRCAITRSLCGYVIVPVEYKKKWESKYKNIGDFEDIYIHGGITYYDIECLEIYGNHIVIGFDCSQSNDIKPVYIEEELDLHGGFYINSMSYKNIHYVQNECKKLAFQIREILNDFDVIKKKY